MTFALLRAFRWRVVLAQPAPKRCIVVFYPHTSNWDFVLGLAAKWSIGIDFRWLGKHTLFATPFERWLVRWGGIPVNRGDPRGVVDQVAARFAAHEAFALVITPEGTRRRSGHWKSGFYRLARAADVPVGLAFIDRRTRRIGIGDWMTLCGDPDRDLAVMRRFYADKRGWRPENAGEIVFRAHE